MTLFWDRQNRPIEDVIVWAKKFEDVGYRAGRGRHRWAWPADGVDDLAGDWTWPAVLCVTDETAYDLRDGVLGERPRPGYLDLAHSEQEAAGSGIDWHAVETVFNVSSRPEDGHLKTIIEREAK